MAEAVISVCGSILASLITQALEKVGNLACVESEPQELRDIVSMLRAMLDQAEKQYHQSAEIKDWVGKLKEAFYEAQDVLEEFNIEAMRRELRGDNKMIKEVRTFFSSSNQLAFALKMSRKVTALRKRKQVLEAEKKLPLDERSVDSRTEIQWRETHSFIREQGIIGREHDKKKVREFLLNLDVKEDVSILPIVGVGGLGKTALAQYVYNDEMVSRHFNLKMWVCVSNPFDLKKIVKNIIVCAKGEAPKDGTLQQLQSELRKKIDGKRYFLVLDDLWNKEQDLWLELKTLLDGGARGSKILITTRHLLVANITGTASPHLLSGLSENASLDLLLRMARREKEEMRDLDMLNIAKEIVEKCSGVPLVVRTVGGLLLSKKTRLEWSGFKDEKLPQVYESEEKINSVLRLSYNHLSLHLKQCFALCSLFPKDYQINKQDLVDLWMAEGFIQPTNGSQHLEDIAHRYFMELLWSNFFQDFKEDEETCKMHDLMHDLACSVAGTDCWVAWDDKKPIHEKTRHISYDFTSNLMDKLPISWLKASELRTYLFAPKYKEMVQRELTSEANLHELIQRFKRLRVLDLHDTNVEKVPRSICKLKHLTYVDLSDNRALKRLPNCITRLQNLQTLKLNDCFRLEELPRDIRKLVSLQNLDIDGCCELSYLPCGLGKLGSLHRLTNFILPKNKALAKNCCGLGELNGLNNIRGKLCIDNLESVTDAVAESETANLIEKRFLEFLILSWNHSDTDDAITKKRDEALLDGLRPHENLQRLTIVQYNGESFPSWMANMPYLIRLRLQGCRRCRHFPQFGRNKLKHLEIHKMEFLEYVPEKCLKSLTSLESLKIEECPRLTSLALGLQHLSKLVDLSIEDCEELDLSKDENSDINILDLHGGLQNLRSLTIKKLPKLESLPQWLPQARNLERLVIIKCCNLKAMTEQIEALRSLQRLFIKSCPSLTSLPEGMRRLASLTHLDIFDCKELHSSKDESGNIILDFHGGLQSLRSVAFVRLPKLESLPQWLLQARNLECLEIIDCWNLKVTIEQIGALGSVQQLKISDCDELHSSKDESGNIISDFHGGLQSLRSVKFSNLSNLESLPQWLLQARNLECLEIIKCWNLKVTTEQIGALGSLQQLKISDCKELYSSKDESGNIILDFRGGLQSLRSVAFVRLPKLESLPQWLLQARNLKCLEIIECWNLKVTTEQIETLGSLQQLKISDCEELHSSKDESGNIISDFHGGLQSLRSMDFDTIPELESLLQWLLQGRNLECLNIEHCNGLKALLERIEHLQSLQRLNISKCSLTSLPEGMRGLASLTHLCIDGCVELDLSKDERGNILDFHGELQSLRSIKISFLPKVESLPPWLLQLSNLEHLEISDCANLKALPEQIEALQSLQQLKICDCPSLTSLPKGMRRLISLTRLQIIRCPELKERCKRDAGEDWCKIAHIPNIYILR